MMLMRLLLMRLMRLLLHIQCDDVVVVDVDDVVVDVDDVVVAHSM